MAATDVGPPGLAGLATATSTYTTKQDFVAAVLREAIVNGSLAPGQRLRQEDVSRRLGLSWTPVREAFRLLEAEGWLSLEPHRGAVVTALTLEDFEDIYLLRVANEPLAARLSAERANEQSIAAMASLVERLAQLAADWPRFLQLEREFHSTQYRRAGRRRLYEVVMGLRDAAERYLRASVTIPDEPSHHLQVHADLLRACQRRDGDLAERTMRRALERVLTRMRPVLARTLRDGPGSGAPRAPAPPAEGRA